MMDDGWVVWCDDDQRDTLLKVREMFLSLRLPFEYLRRSFTLIGIKFVGNYIIV